jgi:hypothetical protein
MKLGFDLWKSEMRPQMSGGFDWAKVAEAQARELSEHLLRGADVPDANRTQHCDAFDKYLKALRRGAP